MKDKSTILISKDTIGLLQKAKDHPRQTYDELLRHLSKQHLLRKKNNQYDEFLHKIQQQKMRELWDNDADEGWERA
ncbi:MAG: hypothetical protein AABX51_07840 [Nanoarchaeota archaeon]